MIELEINLFKLLELGYPYPAVADPKLRKKRLQKGLLTISSSDIVGFCVPTNGYVTKDGKAVCGRGVARLTADWYDESRRGYTRDTDFQRLLGRYYEECGTAVNPITRVGSKWIINFPTKPAFCKGKDLLPKFRHLPKDREYPGWMSKSDIDLIARSARQLEFLRCRMGFYYVILPRPGCGNGGLNWEEDVRPVLQETLSDYVIVVHSSNDTHYRAQGEKWRGV